MERIIKLLPHVCIILAGMFITFFIISLFNGAASVLGDNATAKTLLCAFSIIAIAVAVMLIRKQRMEQ